MVKELEDAGYISHYSGEEYYMRPSFSTPSDRVIEWLEGKISVIEWAEGPGKPEEDVLKSEESVGCPT